MSFAPSRRESLPKKRRSSPPRCQPVLRRAKRGNVYLQPGVPSRAACLFSSLHFGVLCAVRPLCVTVGFSWPRSEREHLGQRSTRSEEGCRVVQIDQQAPGGLPLILKLGRCLCAVRVRFRVVLFLLSFCNVNVIRWSIRQNHGFRLSGALGVQFVSITRWKAVFCGASCWVSCQPCQGRRDGCRGILAKMSRWMRGFPRSTEL